MIIYFGSIPSRVLAYMQELEYEAIKLGIPLKTRHNEVAPGQFEMAPVFEEANLSVDHNSLEMDLMPKIDPNTILLYCFMKSRLKGSTDLVNTTIGHCPPVPVSIY